MHRIEQRKVNEAIEERKRNEKVNIHRVKDIQAYHRILDKVREQGRTPLVVSSLQNPIETGDLIMSMGWDMDVMKNIWLRTASFLNNNSLNWLRNTRAAYRKTYEECLQTGEPWVMNLILDEDEEAVQPWPHQYDPGYDFLFGNCGPGLPSTVWEGKHIF